jgi:hypothetical protein
MNHIGSGGAVNLQQPHESPDEQRRSLAPQRYSAGNRWATAQVSRPRRPAWRLSLAWLDSLALNVVCLIYLRVYAVFNYHLSLNRYLRGYRADTFSAAEDITKMSGGTVELETKLV